MPMGGFHHFSVDVEIWLTLAVWVWLACQENRNGKAIELFEHFFFSEPFGLFALWLMSEIDQRSNMPVGGILIIWYFYSVFLYFLSFAIFYE